MFNKMAKDSQLKPTAKKFHYQFNMRDFAKIVQNIMLAQANVYKGQHDQKAAKKPKQQPPKGGFGARRAMAFAGVK